MANWYDTFLSQFSQGGSPGGVTNPVQSSTPFMDMLTFQQEYGGNANYGAPGSPETTGGLMAAPSTATGGNTIDRAMTLMNNKRGVMNAPQGQVGGMPSQARNTLGELSDYFGGGLGPKGKAKLQGTGFDWAGGQNNFRRMAGGFAQALAPNSFGGRLGGLARAIADNDVQSQRDVDKTLMSGFMRQATKGTGRGSGNLQAFKAGEYIRNEDGTFTQVPPEVKNEQVYPKDSFVKLPDGSFKQVGGEGTSRGKVQDKYMVVGGSAMDAEGNFKTPPQVPKDQTAAERKEEREAQGAAAVVGDISTQPPGERRTPGVGPFGMLPTGSLPFGLAGSSVTVPSEEQQIRDQFAPIIAAEKDYERKALLTEALNKRIDNMRRSNKNVPMPTRPQVMNRPGESSFKGPAPVAPPVSPGVVAPPIGLKQGTQGKQGKQPSRVSQLENFSPAAEAYVRQFGGPTMRRKGR